MPATAIRPVEVAMTKTEAKKNSVRFDAEPATGTERPALTSVYVANDAYHALGDPERITVSIAPGATS